MIFQILHNWFQIIEHLQQPLGFQQVEIRGEQEQETDQTSGQSLVVLDLDETI